MSKAKLRKEIAQFTSEQLREMLLDLYDARREAKEYLEFFLDPDVDKLTEKYTKVIDKEFNRTKRRLISPRWTVVRNAIKVYASFKPGSEAVANLMLHTLSLACHNLRYHNVAPTMLNGARRLVTDTLKFGDTHYMASLTTPSVAKIINSIPTTFYHSRLARTELEEAMEAYTPTLE